MDGKQAKLGGINLFLLYIMVFMPVTLLEIFHFCPILFEYYMYEVIDYHELVIYLTIFNVPKLLFLSNRDFDGHWMLK